MLGGVVLKLEKWVLALMQRILFKPFTESGAGFIDHIVVFRVGNFGDTIVAMPALYTLRQGFPRAKITLLTSPGREGLPVAAEVLEPFIPLVDNIETYMPGDLKTPYGIEKLKEKLLAHGKVDLFVSLPVSMQTFQRAVKEMLFARALNARFAMGFDVILPDYQRLEYARSTPQIPKTSDWLTTLVQKSLHKYASTKDYLNLEEAEAVLSKKNFWRKLNLDSEKPLLVVNAGAKLAIKRWPPEHFATVIKSIRQNLPEVQVALLGGADEHALNEQLRLAVALPYVENLAGKTTLSETTWLVSVADAVLSNDTGTMHLAGILNRPVVAVFSGQFPQPLWQPPGDTCTVLVEPVACSPCLLETCAFAEQTCLTQITPEKVMNALAFSLEKSLEARRQFLALPEDVPDDVSPANS